MTTVSARASVAESPRASSDPREGCDLIDPFGRPVNDLRVSLTPACDLACAFCHKEGMPREAAPTPTPDLLRICDVAADLGIRFVKLTGGEPLLRPDVVEIVSALARRFEVVSLVTNGQRLERFASPLQEAGLTRVNVSVHTLDRAEYRAMTGGELEPVLRGVRAAVNAGLAPVKVNVVVTSANFAEIDRLVAWARAEDVTLQLIEVHAPPGGRADVLAQRVSLAPVEERLAARASRVERHLLHHRARFDVDGGIVEITRPHGNPDFCAGCTRLRLTHDGQLKPCLMRSDNHVDLSRAVHRGPEAIIAAFHEATRRRRPHWCSERLPDGS